MRIVCDECNVGVPTHEEWIAHLVSPQHRTIVKGKICSWTKEENERALLVTLPVNQKPKQKQRPITSWDIAWHYSQFVFLSDFYWEEEAMNYAVVQFDSGKELEHLLKTPDFHFIQDGRKLSAQLKSKCKFTLPNSTSSKTNDNKNGHNGKFGVNGSSSTTTKNGTQNGVSSTKGPNAASSSTSKITQQANKTVDGQPPSTSTSNNNSLVNCKGQRSPKEGYQEENKPSTSGLQLSHNAPQNVTTHKNDGNSRDSLKAELGAGESYLLSLKSGSTKSSNSSVGTQSGNSNKKTASNSSRVRPAASQQTSKPQPAGSSSKNPTPKESEKSTKIGGHLKKGNSNQPQSVERLTVFHQTHEILHDEIVKRGFDFDHQLAYLIGKVTLSRQDMEVRESVLQQLKQLLRSRFNTCEIHAFGSFITGLGDPDSDIDIYVNLFSQERNETFDKPDAQHGQTKNNTLRQTLSLLCNYRDIFKEIIPIWGARVPIIKVTHIRTKIHCDLSFENLLSVRNSLLIAFYCELDQRVFALLLLVRYWANFHRLSGPTLVKNYALTLMVLIYLTRKGIIPSIYELQTMQGAEEFKVDGWNAGFADKCELVWNYMASKVSNSLPQLQMNDKTRLPTTRSLLSLISEFFEMYSAFDYKNMVICSLTSEFLQKDSFQPGYEADLPDTLNLYKDWAANQHLQRRIKISKPFCIQDPFDLSFNVGVSVSQDVLGDFIWCCKDTIVRINETMSKPFPLLFNIFVERPLKPNKKKIARAERKKRSQEDAKQREKDRIQKKTLDEILGVEPANSAPMKQVKAKPVVPAQLPLVFTPVNMNRFINGFKKIQTKDVLDDGKIYSLWLGFMENFFKGVFEIAYKMKVLSIKDELLDLDRESSSGPSSASSFDNLLDAISGGETSFTSSNSTERKGTSFMETDENSESNETGESEAKSRQSKRPLPESPPTAQSPTHNEMQTEENREDNEPCASESKSTFKPVAKAARTEIHQQSPNQPITESVIIDSKPEATKAENPQPQPPTVETPSEQVKLLVEALNKVPSLQNQNVIRQITLRIEGNKNFSVNYSSVARAKEVKWPKYKEKHPLEFEGEIIEEILKRQAQSSRSSFDFEVSGLIKTSESAENGTNGTNAAIPEFTIVFSSNTKNAINFCEEFLRKRFRILASDYLQYEFNNWTTRIMKQSASDLPPAPVTLIPIVQLE